MPPLAASALGIAISLDLLLEEPPTRLHPVAWFGAAIQPMDRPWSNPLLVGFGIAGIAPILAGAVVGLTVWASLNLHPALGVIVAGLVLFTTCSLRMLVTVASAVIETSATDIEQARSTLPALVGRNPSTLSTHLVRSAAIESLAENLSDGFAGPLLAFALGAQVSLAIGVGAAAWVKAVNTLDSMLGYRSKPIGVASARLDDVVMWLPARVTAVAIAIAARNPLAVLKAQSWARNPASPNAGWPMATMATVLAVRLEKPGAYVLNPAASPPTSKDGDRAVRLVAIAGFVLVFIVGVVVW